jgi:hypothetical protein
MQTIKGMGDLIENITTATGIKALAEIYTKVTKKDCGCGKRKQALNNSESRLNKLLRKRAELIETNKNNIK